jgi:hypothetical protein
MVGCSQQALLIENDSFKICMFTTCNNLQTRCSAMDLSDQAAQASPNVLTAGSGSAMLGSVQSINPIMTIKQAVALFQSTGATVQKVKGAYKVNGEVMHWQLVVCRAEKMQRAAGPIN